MDAVVLAGGLGTRISHLLPDIPKPLASVAGRPFLEWIVRYLRNQGLQHLTISTGHLAETIESFASGLTLPGLTVSCAVERSRLGTAGGFINALGTRPASDGDILVCNGDSLVLAALSPLFTALKDSTVQAAVMGVQVADASRFGTLCVTPAGDLQGFEEKRPGEGLVNGGVYLFRRSCIARFPDRMPLSFEYDVFPALLAEGAKIRVIPYDAPFLDIGTEASLGQADGFILENMRWFT